MGCAPNLVIFQGIGLRRANGNLIVLQDTKVSSDLQARLHLSKDEMALIEKLPSTTRSAVTASEDCLTLSDRTCRMVSCKDCVLWVADSSGPVREAKPGELIAPPYSFVCRCR
jgi:hypothetical protein